MLKRRLYRVIGSRGYRFLHAAFFLVRLLLALAWKPDARRFFGADMLGLRARVIPVALSSAAGRADLAVPVHAGVPIYSQAGFAGSYDIEALGRSGAYSFQRAEVRTARLDDILAEEGIAPASVTAAKIDVEGAELAVLEGGARFLEAFRGPLVCEFRLDPMPPAGWSRLRDRGWECRKLDAPGGRFREADSQQALAAPARGEAYGNFWWTRGPSGAGGQRLAAGGRSGRLPSVSLPASPAGSPRRRSSRPWLHPAGSGSRPARSSG